MLHTTSSTPSQTPEDRETRVQALLQCLRPAAEHALRQLAERLVDLPEEQSFGQIEYDLRDLVHQLAARVHQTSLQAGKKRGTAVPASSVRTARRTPASSSTATRPG
jgi:hypothetical protein